MMDVDVMQGLTFYEKGRYHIIKLLPLCFRKRKTGSGFASDLFVFLLSIRRFIKALFQGASGTLLTGIADIGRLRKFRAGIFFVRDTGGRASAACPAGFVV